MRRKTGKGNIWRRITSFLQRKYLEKEKIFLEEKKNGEGKGGKYLDTEKYFWEEKKTGKQNQECIWRGKNIFLEEKENEETIWRRKYIFCGEEEKRRRNGTDGRRVGQESNALQEVLWT